MNEVLTAFARETILAGLEQLPEGWQERFRKMYGHELPPETPMEEVVARMPDSKLDWAVQQVERSLAKLSKEEGK